MNTLAVLSFRTIVMYFVILLIFRVMGKREIGELGILDLVVFMMIAEMAVVAIVDLKISLIEAFIPMLILLGIQITLAYISLKNRKIRELLDGKPTIIIYNGKIDEKAMRKERYNFDDLLQQLRTKDIFDLSEVAFALLEPSGELTVMKKPPGKEAELALPLILDGEIQLQNVKYMNRTKEWLFRELHERGHYSIHSISFCIYRNGKLYIDEKDE
ncbi:MAG: DUF421 domain-containing protein [Bacillus sp. (in: firmicutes)]